jgi:hypothetical protein
VINYFVTQIRDHYIAPGVGSHPNTSSEHNLAELCEKYGSHALSLTKPPYDLVLDSDTPASVSTMSQDDAKSLTDWM